MYYFQVKEAVIEVENLISLTSGNSSALSDLVNSGDNQAVSQFVSSLSSILNSKAEDAEQHTGEEIQQQSEQRKEVSLDRACQAS